MGCCVSNVYTKNNWLDKFRPQFEAIRLGPYEIGKLYKLFRKVDLDGSGTIGLGELLMHIDLERTPFTTRIFSIFDEDGSGAIDFREFVLSLWNYLTLSNATLVLFAFDLYDKDSSGVLSFSEIEIMLRDIYGKNVEKNYHSKAILADLVAMDRMEDVDIDAFSKYVKLHQAMLFPAFQMQQQLQRKFFGTSFWERQGSKRIQLSKGKYVSVAQFMKIHLSKDTYNNVVNAQIASSSLAGNNSHNKSALAIASTGSHRDRKELAMANGDGVVTNVILKKKVAREVGFDYSIFTTPKTVKVVPSLDGDDPHESLKQKMIAPRNHKSNDIEDVDITKVLHQRRSFDSTDNSSNQPKRRQSSIDGGDRNPENGQKSRRRSVAQVATPQHTRR
eukprot:gene9776-13151_t